MGVEDYRGILAALGDAPIPGRQAHYVGTEDGALVIVDVWGSREDADRFAAERLFPAFAGVLGGPPASTAINAFDAEVVDA